MSDTVQSESAPTQDAAQVVESPPPAAQPSREDASSDARTRLHQLAQELVRTRNRRLMVEYLKLRRAVR